MRFLATCVYTMIVPKQKCKYDADLAVVSVVHSPAFKGTESGECCGKIDYHPLVNYGISVGNAALNCLLLNVILIYTYVEDANVLTV